MIKPNRWHAAGAGWLTTRKEIFFAAALGLVCFIFPDLYILGLLFLLAGYILLVRRVLTVSIFTGAYLGILLFFSSNALISFLLWAVHIPFLGFAAGLFNAILLLIVPIGYKARLALPKYSGILIALTCAVSFGLLIAPYARNRSPAVITNLIVQGEDNISHIELTKNVLRHNGLYFSNNPEQETHIIKNLAGYPEGMHANFALVMKSLKNPGWIGTANRFLVTYYLLAAASYALLMGSIVFATLYIFGLVSRSQRISAPGAVVLATALIGLGATVFLGLFSAGFLTYIWTPTLLLLTLVFLVTASLQVDLRARRLCVILAALFCAAMQFSWLFLMPFVVPAFFISLFYVEGYNLRRLDWQRAYSALRAHKTAAAIVILSCLQFPVQNRTTAVKVSINDPGYIYRIPLSYIILVLSLVALVSLLLWIRHRRWLRIYLVFISINAVFSLLIYIYQRLTIHDLQYYFFKSEYSLLFLAWPLIIAALILLISAANKLAKSAGRYGAVTLAVLVLITSAVVYKQLVKPNIDTFWPYRWNLADSQADETVVAGYKKPSPINYIILGECQRADDYKLSRLSSVLSENTSSQIRSIYLNILIDQRSTKKDIYNQLSNLQNRGDIRIIDIGNTLPDNGMIHQINLPATDYPSVCSPIL